MEGGAEAAAGEPGQAPEKATDSKRRQTRLVLRRLPRHQAWERTSTQWPRTEVRKIDGTRKQIRRSA